MSASKEDKDTWFKYGQESVDKPLGSLGGPGWKPGESDEDFDERDAAFESGRDSVLNNKD